MKMAVLLLGACLLALTACGHSTPKAPRSSSASPSPSPSVDMAASQSRYLALVGPSNTDLAAYDTTPDTMAAIQPLCSKLVGDNNAFVAGLNSAPWPPVAQDAVNKLVAALGAETAYWQRCASTTDLNAMYDALSATSDAGVDAAANAVRSALGLPAAS